MTTQTLMTTAEMWAHLIEKRREIEAHRAVIAAEQAAQEVFYAVVKAPALEVALPEPLGGQRLHARRSQMDRVRPAEAGWLPAARRARGL